jgi:hypothetical protein
VSERYINVADNQHPHGESLMTIADKVRNRVWHAFGAGAAQASGMTIAQLQQFAIRAFHPSPRQIADLARYFGIRS